MFFTFWLRTSSHLIWYRSSMTSKYQYRPPWPVRQRGVVRGSGGNLMEQEMLDTRVLDMLVEFGSEKMLLGLGRLCVGVRTFSCWTWGLVSQHPPHHQPQGGHSGARGQQGGGVRQWEWEVGDWECNISHNYDYLFFCKFSLFDKINVGEYHR